MTIIYITIDTEYQYSFTKKHGPASRQDNFDRSIVGNTRQGEVGIFYQMSVLEYYGLKAVFFVDPMPSLIWGISAIEDIVWPILARGHDVQMHIHTEWLELAGSSNPLGTRNGKNIKDFCYEDQCCLIDYAFNKLVAAGAPPPVAFRAGNYGANDNTLRALCALGITFDTSYCPGILNSACDIKMTPQDRLPVEYHGTVEIPIGCILGIGGTLRHAQVTAISSKEMLAAINHCKNIGLPNFTLVSHSFELMNRKRNSINYIVKNRFDDLCEGISKIPCASTGTYSKNPPVVSLDQLYPETLPFNLLRYGRRLGEQLISNILYS